MSFAIIKGVATKSQLALDRKLDALVAETGREEDRYSIGRVLFSALRDKPHFINTVEFSSGEHITNGELLDKSVRTARALRSVGLGKGDVVMIMGTKQNFLAVPHYASTFIGALSFHIDENATTDEIGNYLKIGEPKFLFTDANKLESVEQAVRESGVGPAVVSFERQVSSGYQDLETFIQQYSADLESFQLEEVGRGDAAVLICTSGSTGAPKAVALSNYALVASLGSLEICPLNEQERKFLLLSSCQWVSYVLLININTVMCHQKLQSKNPATSSHIIMMLREKPNGTLVPPGLAESILQSEDYKAGDLSSVHKMVVGGAFVSPQLQLRLKKEINPNGEVITISGCTEICGLYSVQSSDCSLESIGKELNYMEYKIVDDNDEEVPIGVTGELWVRGKELFCLGYYKDEASNKDSFTPDGWLKTGDLVYKEDSGQYFYVERKKLLIKFGNYHIYPLEVEGVICSVEGVAKAGVCWTDSGLAALVETRPGAAVTPQQVHHAVNSKLSYYKQLSGGVEFAPLPQTVTGKLDRAALKKILQDLIG